jgi:hypothetical protein
MDEQTTSTTPEPRRGASEAIAWLRESPLRLVGVLVALAIVVGVIIWAVTSGGGSSSIATKGPVVQPIKPVGLSASGLETLAKAVKQPIYWAGPRQHYLYELRRTSDGSVYVRYLPPGTDVGDPKKDYLVVATYPFVGALDALKKLTNVRHIDILGGGVAVVSSDSATSVHLAFPKVDYQVEVYDPSPKTALRIATSGQVKPAQPAS